MILILLTLISHWCFAAIEITGSNSFKYTDSTGVEKKREITGYTLPKNIDAYLQTAISNSAVLLQEDRSINQRTITKVYVIKFANDPTGFIDEHENIGFIVFLNDGTSLLCFDYVVSPAFVESTFDQGVAHAELLSHLTNHGECVGMVEGSSSEPVGLWSSPSSFTEKLKDLGFRRNKAKTAKYQATFLLPNFSISGQGIIDVKNLGTYQYTIVEST